MFVFDGLYAGGFERLNSLCKIRAAFIEHVFDDGGSRSWAYREDDKHDHNDNEQSSDDPEDPSQQFSSGHFVFLLRKLQR
jgi:hypothetical protein